MRESIADLLAAEAEAAEQFRDEDDLGPTYVPRHPAKDPSQVYSVRIPVSRLDQLRKRAAQEGVAPSALMRQWVIERLDADEGMKRTVSSLEALLAAVIAARQPDALWMVARSEGDQTMLVFDETVFANEDAANEEARSSGGVVIPLPVARDYRPGRQQAQA
jgi:hypothetical protein